MAPKLLQTGGGLVVFYFFDDFVLLYTNSYSGDPARTSFLAFCATNARIS
jgi:hypothetical protein